MFNLQIQAKSAEELKAHLRELLSGLEKPQTVAVPKVEPVKQPTPQPSLMGVEKQPVVSPVASVGIKQEAVLPSLEMLKAGLVKWKQENASEQTAFFKSAFNGAFDFTKITKEQMEIVAGALNERGYLSV